MVESYTASTLPNQPTNTLTHISLSTLLRVQVLQQVCPPALAAASISCVFVLVISTNATAPCNPFILLLEPLRVQLPDIRERAEAIKVIILRKQERRRKDPHAPVTQLF